MLPRASVEEAAEVVDRLRDVIGNLDWSAVSDSLAVSMSAGVVQIRSYEALDDILTRVDAALYRAKDAGRNCVVSA